MPDTTNNDDKDLRDYFAGQAMIALITKEPPVYVARVAYEYADAMMKERDREHDHTKFNRS